MSTEIVQVDDKRVVLGLGRLRLGIQQRSELFNTLAAHQYDSIEKTFRQEGSTPGAWPRLSPSTIKSDPKFYGAGHKLLIGRKNHLHRSNFTTMNAQGFTISNNVAYARVHQFGSADRAGAAIGPQARIAGRSVQVGRHSYTRTRRRAAGDKFGTVDRQTSEGFKIKGRRRKLVSGIDVHTTDVKAHERHQNIPPRPYLIFRPEDPARHRALTVAYVNQVARNAGLATGPGAV